MQSFKKFRFLVFFKLGQNSGCYIIPLLTYPKLKQVDIDIYSWVCTNTTAYCRIPHPHLYPCSGD